MESKSLSQERKEIIDVDEFLDKYHYISSLDLKHILNLDFELDYYYKSEKICPIIELAKLEDAKEIAAIFKEIYRENYPYKEMEDVKSLQDMILHPNKHWFLFKLCSKEIVGCFGADLDLNEKKAFLHGFNIKRQYQKTIDIFKAFIACIIFLWREYKDKVFIWYGEMRTNEAISQFFTSLVGMKPIAFLPNKDIFSNNKVESDILHIIFNRDALNKLRFEGKPKVIRQVLNCYSYSNNRFPIGVPQVENPNILLNKDLMKKMKSLIDISTQEDSFGNQLIKIFIKDSNSYISFFLNPFSKNIEHIEYDIVNLEELAIFLEKLKEIIELKNINYAECYVSSYQPSEQKVFYEAGFRPRGYIPSWKYDAHNNKFLDSIMFNYFKGSIDKNIKLIPESNNLLSILNLPLNKEVDFKSLINIG